MMSKKARWLDKKLDRRMEIDKERVQKERNREKERERVRGKPGWCQTVAGSMTMKI